jgi:hypothetical protein
MKILPGIVPLCAAACCAVMFLPGVAAGQVRLIVRMSGVHDGGVAAKAGHWKRTSRNSFRRSDHRFRRGKSFGLAYDQAPYLSGTFPLGQAEEGGPIPDENPDYYEPLPQPCVVPLVIELKPRRASRHMPEITYGSPSFCPPPVIAEAH